MTLQGMGLEVDIRHNYRLNYQQAYFLPSSNLLNVINNYMNWDFNDVSDPDDMNYYKTLIDKETEFEMKNRDRIKTFLYYIEKYL